ncbi:hypothetical protein, partial [Staphylococcus aureus]|uniref:hypothetical protein n=1 Tax=Staphylococcus aureus TaxID=1280 RepID=UPI001C931911
PIQLLPPLNYLLIARQVFNPNSLHFLNQKPKHPQIINPYPPTQNTTFTTTYNIPNKLPNPIPIPKPILPTHLYIMQGDPRSPRGIPPQLSTSR